MFAALFAFVLVTTCAAKEIPSYIRVCGRQDANYAECVKENINNMRPKICTGMPELDIPAVEPINVDKIVIYDLDNLKLSIMDGKITGFCDFEVETVTISPDKMSMEFEVLFEHLNLDSMYDFDIHVLVQLANKGKVHIATDKVKGKVVIDFKEATKDNVKQIYVGKTNTKLDINTFVYEFDDSEKDLVQLHEVMRNTISENENDILKKVRPALEQIVSKTLLSLVNKITVNRFEELFPDQAP
ncbi:hypothetical protein PUN28_018773 [Cardiocondyla obscurior]|uniref:Uncharacterized protein n=1 Tax=Cardiocondyla obscurior TaxID=286306 RepID=A0AAW2EHN7_9HYME